MTLLAGNLREIDAAFVKLRAAKADAFSHGLPAVYFVRPFAADEVIA